LLAASRAPPKHGFGVDALAHNVAIVLQAGALALGYDNMPVYGEESARLYLQAYLGESRSNYSRDRMQPFREHGPSFKLAVELLHPPPPPGNKVNNLQK
jgi:hypothetical protein